jgi:hypothetical protein
MTVSPGSRIAHTLRAAAPPLIVALTAAILLRFPPAQGSFYPRCPIYEYLHLQCPGCGATRALAALLRGHFSEAMHLNALITPLSPFAAVCCIRCYRRFLQRKPIRWQRISPVALYVAFGVIAVFAVARNLSSQSF